MTPEQQAFKVEYEIFAAGHDLTLVSFLAMSPTAWLMYVSGQEGMQLTKAWLDDNPIVRYYRAEISETRIEGKTVYQFEIFK